MISPLLVAGLLLLPSANAFFRLPCAKPVLNARVDPIVNPGAPSSHSHTIVGGNAIGLSSSFETMRKSECSTCKVKDDKSAYWAPQLHYEYKNGSFGVVPHGGMLVYYLQRNAQGETVEAFPDGLRMLTGNPYLRSNPNNQESKAISWLCIDFNGPAVPQTPGMTNTNCPSGLRAQVFFPSCWDGVNLDSPDHKSHMAYPDGIDNGRCPATHPHHLVSIFYEIWFQVDSFNKLNDGGRFTLSNGDPTGFGLHADFMNGWDRSVLSRAVSVCTAQSGVIEDCPVFQNEGRFYTDDEMNKCSATNPLPDENNEPGTLLAHLPGCVAVTDGPANATPANVVPGCVAGKAGAVLPNSASSSAPSSASSMAPAGSTMPKPSSSSSSASGTPVPTGNQLAGVPSPSPSSSTFTTDLAGASNILNGAAPPPMSTPSPSPSATGDGDNSGSCGTAMPDPDASAHHRRSRMQRRHGSRLSN